MKPPTQIEVPGRPNAVTSARLKRSELASTLGAALFGGGLGLLVARYVADLTGPLLLAGALVHAWGMYDKHAIERDLGRPEAPWMRALYWLCWLVLAGVAATIILRALLYAASVQVSASAATGALLS